jgi:hypothetical protein
MQDLITLGIIALVLVLLLSILTWALGAAKRPRARPRG